MSAAAPGDVYSCPILVVDDNEDSAEMMKMLLELEGHHVRIAHDGRSAMTVVGDFQPAIGFLDIGLPDISGYDLARQLRADPRCAQMFLVAVTGWGQEDDRERARAHGFDAHLTKPAPPEEIRRLVQRVGRR